MAFNNSNIKFLQGSYDALSKLQTSQLGAFYVTNDTHEMFLGVDASKPPVALNRWVDVKENWAAVQAVTDYRQHPGKMYYATAENILCTWTAEKGWVQINPDTNDNTSTASIDFSNSVPVSDAEGNVTGYKYTLTLSQQDKNKNVLTPALTAEFTITNDMVTNLVVDVAVGLEASVTDGKATIKTVGTGVDTTKVVTLTGDGGVTVSGTGSDIKITGTTYELTSPETGAAQVVLHSKDADTAVLFEGDAWINPTANGEGKIKIEHAAPGAGEELATTAGAGVSVSATDRKFTALTGIQRDAKGHIVGATATEFTIPNSNFEVGSEEGEVSITNGEVTEKASFTRQIELRDANNDNVISEVDVKTAHTITVDGTQRIVANGGDLGSFYSASAIDNKFKLADAMVYRGSIDSAIELEGKTFQIGDTYKAGSEIKDFELGDGTTVTVAPGDLLIANVAAGSTENADGTIDEENLVWDHIATGSDTDTQYKIQGTDNKIQLVYANGIGSGNAVADAFVAVTDDDEYIEATVANNTLSIKHLEKVFSDESITAAPTAGSSIDVVTAVEKDDAGHINGVKTTTVTLPGADKVVLTEDNFTVTDAAGITKGNLHFADGAKTVATTEVDETNKTLTVKFDHATQTVVESEEDKDQTINLSAEADENRTFSVLESVSHDAYGHITGYQAKDITIGKQSAYSLTGPSVNENVVTQTMQRDGATAVGSINLASDTLTYSLKTVGDTTLTQINMVWGSFEATV